MLYIVFDGHKGCFPIPAKTIATQSDTLSGLKTDAAMYIYIYICIYDSRMGSKRGRSDTMAGDADEPKIKESKAEALVQRARRKGC